ncbi:hypothetical protein K443DRAFT_627679 [Laccaria amethystina LaAM-08-1]|uniref:Uncharacterized protein n=1 Tax=Laccaria amethystina LaAM-08-1 TaxID=1095629 RepID=A0A0C9XM63_9AGAR|nr:hypothetical protein K443DRAFT_627679 [Laccaria amethystina LaAM-08-1]
MQVVDYGNSSCQRHQQLENPNGSEIVQQPFCPISYSSPAVQAQAQFVCDDLLSPFPIFSSPVEFFLCTMKFILHSSVFSSSSPPLSQKSALNAP